jgi:PKD repeat protein
MVMYTETNAAGCSTIGTTAVKVNTLPVASFKYTRIGKTLAYHFAADSTKYTAYSYMGDDALSAFTDTFTHTYPKLGTYKVMLMVIDGNGCKNTNTDSVVVYTGIAQTNASVASLTVAPNPFNDVTTISYTLTQASNVNIYLTDVQGKSITLVNNALVPAGNYSATINAGNLNLSAGIYMLRMETGNSFINKQLIRIK